MRRGGKSLQKEGNKGKVGRNQHKEENIRKLGKVSKRTKKRKA